MSRLLVFISFILLLLTYGCSNDSGKHIYFTEVSDGLPGPALWRENIEVADLNDDGLLDIVAPPPRYHLGEALRIFINKGDRWERATPQIPALPYDYGWIESGPIGSATYPSLVINSHHSSVYALRGISPLFWNDASSGLPLRFGGNYLDLGDINNDGILDIAATIIQYTPDAPLTNLFYGSAAGAWQSNPGNLPYGLFGSMIRLADFNNDGFLDIAVASGNSAMPDFTYFGDGKGQWQVSSGLPDSSVILTLNTADVNSDGYDDLLLITFTGDATKPLSANIYFGGPYGFIKSPAVFTTSDVPVTISSGYIDCDAKIDIVIGTLSGIEVFVQRDGGLFEKAYEIATLSYPGFIKVADLYKKGSDDIAAAFSNTESGGIRVWTNNLQCGNTRIKKITDGSVLKAGALRKIEYTSPVTISTAILKNSENSIPINTSLYEHGRIWIKIPQITEGWYDIILGNIAKRVYIAN